MNIEKPIDQYRRLLEQLHVMEARGEEYNEKHDPMLDQMDRAWSMLSPSERQQMRELSKSIDARNGKIR